MTASFAAALDHEALGTTQREAGRPLPPFATHDQHAESVIVHKGAGRDQWEKARPNSSWPARFRKMSGPSWIHIWQKSSPELPEDDQIQADSPRTAQIVHSACTQCACGRRFSTASVGRACLLRVRACVVLV